ncbi:MAG: carboxypeptidase-like regulatory domain-containing protein, partial [Bacteroidia bacterium]
MKKLLFFLFFIIVGYHNAKAQSKGTITGIIKDKNTQELLTGATILLEGTSFGAQSDLEVKFKISGITPGSYNIKVQYIGYQPKTLFNIVVTTGNVQTFNIEIEPESKGLNEVVVQSRTFGKKTETPLRSEE